MEAAYNNPNLKNYVAILEACQQQFGSDHDALDRFYPWIMENIEKDITLGILTEQDFNDFMDMITDLY